MFSASIVPDLSKHHYNRAWRCISVRSKRHNGRCEFRFCSLSRLTIVMLDKCFRVVRLMVDHDETGVLTIVLSPRPFVVLDLPLPSRPLNLPVFIHTCQHHLIVSTQMPSDSTICPSNLFQFNDTTSFKLWNMLIMTTNPLARHYYTRRRISAVEMQQEVWTSDPE